MRISGFSSNVCIVMVYITLFFFHTFADVMHRFLKLNSVERRQLKFWMNIIVTNNCGSVSGANADASTRLLHDKVQDQDVSQSCLGVLPLKISPLAQHMRITRSLPTQFASEQIFPMIISGPSGEFQTITEEHNL